MKLGVLLDLDGTLLDTLEDLCDGVNYALAQFGLPGRSLGEIRTFVGNGAKNLIARSLPTGASSQQIEQVLSVFQAYYKAHCQIKTKPYHGILQALKQIQAAYPVAVVSNKPDGAVKALCQEYFPGIYALGESSGIPRKPAPDMLKKAMADIGVTHCVYVGDSEVDVLTAQNANVPCLSVTWGFRDRELLTQAGATCFCDEISALPQALKKIIGANYE